MVSLCSYLYPPAQGKTADLESSVSAHMEQCSELPVSQLGVQQQCNSVSWDVRKEQAKCKTTNSNGISVGWDCSLALDDWNTAGLGVYIYTIWEVLTHLCPFWDLSVLVFLLSVGPLQPFKYLAWFWPQVLWKPKGKIVLLSLVFAWWRSLSIYLQVCTYNLDLRTKSAMSEEVSNIYVGEKATLGQAQLGSEFWL